MAKDLYFKILKRLKKEGVSKPTDITDLLEQNFKNVDEYDHWWNLKTIDIENYLISIDPDKKYLTYKIDEFDVGGYASKQIKVFASITPDGYDYYKRTKILFWTIFIAISTVLGTLGIWWGINKNDESALKAKQHQGQTKQKDH